MSLEGTINLFFYSFWECSVYFVTKTGKNEHTYLPHEVYGQSIQSAYEGSGPRFGAVVLFDGYPLPLLLVFLLSLCGMESLPLVAIMGSA
jgi:hypothetical protein